MCVQVNQESSIFYSFIMYKVLYATFVAINLLFQTTSLVKYLTSLITFYRYVLYGLLRVYLIGLDIYFVWVQGFVTHRNIYCKFNYTMNNTLNNNQLSSFYILVDKLIAY
jgi:hypothetical protein